MCSNLLLHSSLHSFRTLQDQCSLSMETQLANHFTMYQEIPIHARNMYRILSNGICKLSHTATSNIFHPTALWWKHFVHTSAIILVQPTPVPISLPDRPTSGDNYLTLSVLMTFLVLLVGGWPSLLCTISALFVSLNAKEEEKRGNIAAARAKANISLGLNIAAVVFVVVVWSVVAIPVAVTVSAQTSAKSPYCSSAASSLYYCYQSSCYLYFHGLYYNYCYYSNSYSYSAASNYYSNGYQTTYYQCGLSYQLICV
eukprot:Em0002g1103a